MATGYGVDISCTSRLQTGRLVGGRVLLKQAIFRRLSTPRGTLYGSAEEAAYGVDVASYVGSVGLDLAIAALPGVVQAELLKDDRIAAVVVDASSFVDTDGSEAIRLRVVVTPSDETESFSLTLAVSDVAVSVIGGFQ